MIKQSFLSVAIASLVTIHFASDAYAGKKVQEFEMVQMGRTAALKDPNLSFQDWELEAQRMKSGPTFRQHLDFTTCTKKQLVGTILFTGAVFTIIGGTALAIKRPWEQGSKNTTSTDLLTTNITTNATTGLWEVPSPTTTLVTTTTHNPFDTIHQRLDHIGTLIQSNGHQVTQLEQQARNLQKELTKKEQQIEKNRQFRGRQQAEKEARLTQERDTLQQKLEQKEQELQRTQQQLSNEQREKQQLEQQLNQQKQSERQETCLKNIAQQEMRNPVDLKAFVQRVQSLPLDQRAAICRDNPIKRAAEECFQTPCPVDQKLPNQPGHLDALKNIASRYRISSPDSWSHEMFKIIPQMSQEKLNEYKDIPPFQEAVKIMGRQFTDARPQLSAGIEPALTHPVQSHFHINLQYPQGFEALHPDAHRLFENVARRWEEIIIGVHGRAHGHTINIDVKITAPQHETHRASAGPNTFLTGVGVSEKAIPTTGEINFREDWLPLFDLSEQSLASTFGHEFTHMFAGSHLEGSQFLTNFQSPKNHCFVSSADQRNTCSVFTGPKATQAFENALHANGLTYDTFYPQEDPRRGTRGVPFGNHGHTDLMRDSFRDFCDSHGNAHNCPQGACINDVMLGWLEDLGLIVNRDAAQRYQNCTR